MSLLVLTWNGALFGYEDLSNVAHPGIFGDGMPNFLLAQLPIGVFTLSSPALGLLLVFRTNTSYSRWLEARQAWGRIVSHCRNIMRQATLWIEEDSGGDDSAAERCLEELGLCVWAFPRSLWAHLSDPAKEPRFAAEVREAFGEEEASELLLGASHRPVRALALLSGAMDRLPIDEKKKVEMDKSVILLGDASEVCERIFSSPVPLVYTRHTARFLSAWLLLLPLGLYDSFGGSWNHAAMLPAAVIVSIFLFGIEELAVQLEEPFSILPLEALCRDVRKAADEVVAGRATARAPLLRRSTPSPSRRRVADATMMLAPPPELLEPAMAAVASPADACEAGSLLLASLSAGEARQRYFLAGGLCASISHALATPIDVVKTRQQTLPEYRDVSLPDGLARVVSEEGPAALLTGIVPTVVGYGAEGALKFGAYEALKPSATALLATLGLSAEQGASLGPIASAIVAGGLASLVLAPAEATRIAMVSDATYADLGLLGAASRLLETQGAAGLLRGVPAICSKQLPYTATKQVSFDALVDTADAVAVLPRWASTAIAAACAAVLSTLASQPGDAILSEVSRGSSEPGRDRTIRGAAAQLGAAGLALGLRARLVQVGVIVTVQLILYDTLKHAFGVP